MPNEHMEDVRGGIIMLGFIILLLVASWILRRMFFRPWGGGFFGGFPGMWFGPFGGFWGRRPPMGGPMGGMGRGPMGHGPMGGPHGMGGPGGPGRR